MHEVLVTLIIALCAIALVAMVAASLRVLNSVAGAWVSAGGMWSRPRRAPPPEEPVPISRPWPPRADEEFFPTYLPGTDTSAELVSALARARAPVRLEHIVAVCKSFRVRCEMRGVDGRIHGFMEADGTSKQA